jgi:heterodisulfide reductase subunit A-like polyferredoxin
MTSFWKALAEQVSRPASVPLDLTPRRVSADATRCVQCGVCGYNCPVGIDVRSHARAGLPVTDASCISCGNCIAVCPRGTLRWESLEGADE